MPASFSEATSPVASSLTSAFTSTAPAVFRDKDGFRERRQSASGARRTAIISATTEIAIFLRYSAPISRPSARKSLELLARDFLPFRALGSPKWSSACSRIAMYSPASTRPASNAHVVAMASFTMIKIARRGYGSFENTISYSSRKFLGSGNVPHWRKLRDRRRCGEKRPARHFREAFRNWPPPKMNARGCAPQAHEYVQLTPQIRPLS